MTAKDNTNPKALAALLKKLKPREGDAPERTPIEQMVLSFLHWETSRRQAEQAYERIMQQMVDVNDLRVSLEHEVLAVLGEDYPLALQRVSRMRESLNEVYKREHDINMTSIANKGKKEQRAYLDSLPGIPCYVAAQVMLLSFGGAAVPVDHKLVALLAREEIVEEGMDTDDVESFILKNIKADEALEVHQKLQAWADESRLTPQLTGPTPTGSPVHAAPDKPARKPTKKTAKKTTRR